MFVWRYLRATYRLGWVALDDPPNVRGFFFLLFLLVTLPLWGPVKAPKHIWRFARALGGDIHHEAEAIRIAGPAPKEGGEVSKCE